MTHDQSASLAVAIGAAALFAFAVVLEHSPPTKRITLDEGGAVGEYIEKYAKWRRDRAHVVIDGVCISACTMITGLIPDDRVCITPRARLAFHSARQLTMLGPIHSSEGTRLVWHIYPEHVRALLLAREWDGDSKEKNEHPDLIYVEGEELAALYKPCKET